MDRLHRVVLPLLSVTVLVVAAVGFQKTGSVSGPAGVVSLATWEYVDGGDVVVQAAFKAYYTLEQSIDDHGGFFTRNRRYADALAVAGDAHAFARAHARG